jgi:hypothetical protein
MRQSVRRGDRDLLLRGADELAGHRLVSRARLAQPHARVTAEEAAVVLGLRQRTVLAGRGDLQRVAVAIVAQMPGDPLAEAQGDAVRMVDHYPQRASSHDLSQHQLDLGFGLGQ